MRQSTRLIVNTLATMGRMAVTVGMGLVVTRLAIALIGDEEFGLLMLLGAGGLLLRLVAASLAGATQRHIAHAIGAGDPAKTRAVVSTAEAIFLAIGLLVFLAGNVVAGPLVSVLSVPEGREAAAELVFRITVLQLAFVVALTPMRTYAVASQAMLLIAVYETATSIMRLIAVLLLTAAPWLLGGDQLISLAWLFCAAIVGGYLVLTGVVLWREPLARPDPRAINRADAARIVRFGGWSMLATLVSRVRMQGSQFLLNIAFGTVVNAGYAVATQLNGYQQSVGGAVQRAAQPALVTAHGRGRMGHVQMLTTATSKHLVLMASFFAVPAVLQTEGLLRLWLGDDVPAGSAPLVQVVILWGLLKDLAIGHMNAVHAHGRIGAHSTMTAGLEIGALVVSVVLLFVFKLPPVSLPLTTLASVVLSAVLTAVFFGEVAGVRPAVWVRRTLVPVASVIVSGGVPAMLVAIALGQGPVGLLLTVASYVIFAAPAAWYVGFDAEERGHFGRLFGAAASRLPVIGRGRPAVSRSGGVADA